MVLTESVLREVQLLLDEGHSVSEAAKKLSLKPDTLSKAIRAGRLHKPIKKKALTPRFLPPVKVNEVSKTA